MTHEAKKKEKKVKEKKLQAWNLYMLFTRREVRNGKNCARGLGYHPRP